MKCRSTKFVACQSRGFVRQCFLTTRIDIADKAIKILSDHSSRVNYGCQPLLVPGVGSLFHAPCFTKNTSKLLCGKNYA